MSNINIRDDFDVQLIEWSGTDEFICRAARVSTMGAESLKSDEFPFSSDKA